MNESLRSNPIQYLLDAILIVLALGMLYATSLQVDTPEIVLQTVTIVFSLLIVATAAQRIIERAIESSQ